MDENIADGEFVLGQYDIQAEARPIRRLLEFWDYLSCGEPVIGEDTRREFKDGCGKSAQQVAKAPFTAGVVNF